MHGHMMMVAIVAMACLPGVTMPAREALARTGPRRPGLARVAREQRRLAMLARGVPERELPGPAGGRNSQPTKEEPVKTITVECTWKSVHTIEVPDDYRVGPVLDETLAEQVDARTAELVDWAPFGEGTA